MKLLRLTLVVLFVAAWPAAFPALGAEPTTHLLWPNGAPGAVGTEDADKPSVTLYPAPKEMSTGAVMLVCPGGGYGGLANNHEGTQIAEWCNSMGVTAVVLKYRLAPRYHNPAPRQDVQRAIRFIRSQAKEWEVDPNRLAIIGFSAGGHLASTAATHFDSVTAEGDEIDKLSCRPDLAVLCYAVITMTKPFTHMGSRENLLGKTPDEALVEEYSNETRVTKETPPTFLFHTGEDTAVPPENSVLFYSALRKAGVVSEMHIYEKGGHGVGLAKSNPALATWPSRCADWLKGRGFFEPAKPVAATGTKEADTKEMGTKELKLSIVTFQVPESWTQVKPQTRIVEAEFAFPKAEGDEYEGRLTLMKAAGTAEDSLARWAGEFLYAKGSKLPMTEELKIGEVTAKIVEIRGAWKGTVFKPIPPRPDYCLRAVILPVGGQEGYFVKLVGPAKTIDERRKEFDAFVQSAVMAKP